LVMKSLDILEKYKNLVYPEVKKSLTNPDFPKAFETPKKFKSLEEFHWQVIKEYPERQGKYLRPTLLILTGQSLGVPLKKMLKTAVAMQLSEDWLLIHDDFEDKSILRRGKPTLNILFGDELAVNAGDALHALMWKVIFDNVPILGFEKTQKILNEFFMTLARTTLGQTAEIKWAREKITNFDNDDWYFIADGKTSYYTIACPMRLAAIIADRDEKELEKLAEFGLYLGRCFQLTDDILDITSDFQGKKEFANDIYEGKKTVLLAHLFEKLKYKPKEREKLEEILLKPRDKKSEEEVLWVIGLMRRWKAIEYAKKLAEENKKKAKKFFVQELKFLSHEPYRSQLESLIDFILERKS